MKIFQGGFLLASVVALPLLALLCMGAEDRPASGAAGEDIKLDIGDNKADREEVLRLHRLLGFDARRGVLTKSFDESALQVLVTSTKAGSWGVQNQAFVLMEMLVKQGKVPTDAAEREIVPVITKAIDTYGASSRQDEQQLGELARRIAWQIRVRSFQNVEETTEFLRTQLGNREDGYYYRFEAIDQLAEISTPTARAAIEDQLAQSRSHSTSQKMVERLRMGLEKMEVIRSIHGQPRPQQVTALAESVATHKNDQSQTWREFRVWAVRRLAKLAPESLGVLGEISKSTNEYDESCRLEAEIALAWEGTKAPPADGAAKGRSGGW